jgi:hypothetical protein
MATRQAPRYWPAHAPGPRSWWRRPATWIAAAVGLAAVLAVTLTLALSGGGGQWTPRQVAQFTGNVRPGVSAPAWLNP